MPAYQITPLEAEELRQSHQRAWNRVEAAQRKEKTIKETGLQAGEVAIGALAFGVLHGRGQSEFRNIPLDLVAGVVLHGAGLWMGGRKPSAAAHLHNLGDGAMASFFTMLGANLGAKTKTPATAASGEGDLPLMLGMGSSIPTRGPLTDRELLSLIQSTAPRPIPVSP